MTAPKRSNILVDWLARFFWGGFGEKSSAMER
jgi:hypothetical protein